VSETAPRRPGRPALWTRRSACRLRTGLQGSSTPSTSLARRLRSNPRTRQHPSPVERYPGRPEIKGGSAASAPDPERKGRSRVRRSQADRTHLAGSNAIDRSEGSTKHHAAVTGDGLPVCLRSHGRERPGAVLFERLFLTALAVLART